MRDRYNTSAEISVHSFKSMKSMLSIIYKTDLYFIRERERERENLLDFTHDQKKILSDTLVSVLSD